MPPPDLVTPVYEAAKRRIRITPQHTNRASSLGGECERELVYARTHWDKASPHSPDLQLVFDEGNLQEAKILKDLQEAGFQIIEQQVSLELKDQEITAHPDGVLIHEGKGYPLDCKSMNPNIWASVFFRGPGVYQWHECAEKFASKPYLKKYRAQVTIYCLAKNYDTGILVFKNKSNGSLAQVVLPLDYEYAESLLKKAERINEHVKASTLPERIPFDPEICPRCRFYSECLPECVGHDPLEFVDDSRLQELLEMRSGREEAGRDFSSLDKRAKDIIKAKPWRKAAIGPFLIQKNGTDRIVVKIERIGEIAKTGELIDGINRKAMIEQEYKPGED